jgi:hypothetical protein
VLLKRRNTMSEENIVCTNELTIRFDQMEDGTVHWSVIPDERTWNARDLSLIDLAEHGINGAGYILYRLDFPDRPFLPVPHRKMCPIRFIRRK